MSKFSIGDKVKVIGNNAWGKEQMEVYAITGFIVSCKHPSLGNGGFYEGELEMAGSTKVKGGTVFKGDVVFAISNPAWGMEPMTVLEIMEGCYVRCLHPALGRGLFTPGEIEVFSNKRDKEINNLKFLKDLLSEATNKAFSHN